MFTANYIAKNVTKALAKKAKYRQCKRCGYLILNELPGCPNCNGLSDEDVQNLAKPMQSQAGRPPELGGGVVLGFIVILIAAVGALGFLLVFGVST